MHCNVQKAHAEAPYAVHGGTQHTTSHTRYIFCSSHHHTITPLPHTPTPHHRVPWNQGGPLNPQPPNPQYQHMYQHMYWKTLLMHSGSSLQQMYTGSLMHLWGTVCGGWAWGDRLGVHLCCMQHRACVCCYLLVCLFFSPPEFLSTHIPLCTWPSIPYHHPHTPLSQSPSFSPPHLPHAPPPNAPPPRFICDCISRCITRG